VSRQRPAEPIILLALDLVMVGVLVAGIVGIAVVLRS
jgi:hypothetical protein